MSSEWVNHFIYVISRGFPKNFVGDIRPSGRNNKKWLELEFCRTKSRKQLLHIKSKYMYETVMKNVLLCNQAIWVSKAPEFFGM